MKIILSVLLFFTLVISGQGLFAQGNTLTQRDITWYSDQNTELHSSTLITASCTIVTHSNTTIDLNWGGTTTFSILSIDGNWTDPSQDGTLTYHIQYQDKQGNIIIQRLVDVITIIIDMTPQFPDGMNANFSVNRFE